MTLDILAFGIVKDIVGKTQFQIEVEQNSSVEAVLQELQTQYPAMQDLASLLVAVNNEYSQPNQILKSSDEIALIPPVSGG